MRRPLSRACALIVFGLGALPAAAQEPAPGSRDARLEPAAPLHTQPQTQPQTQPTADAGAGEAAAEPPTPGPAADAGLAPEADAAVAAEPALEPSLEAADSAASEPDEWALQTNDVVVTGARLIDPAQAPVRAFSVSEAELERQQPVSVDDVLRRVPGVSVRSDDGMGLRPNIGYRGLSADRSRNVLVLEDGVPVAMMPYDYPELYVAPRIERMRSVEVVRGAASIIYGPRTIGGVVNFVTLQPPPSLQLKGEARAGTGGYYHGFALGGDTIGRVGMLLTAMYQTFDGPRHMGLKQTDLMGRLSFDLRKAGELRLKLQFYDENSHTTNLGLTRLQYESGVLDNFAIHDSFPIRRYATQATHQVEFTPDVSLATTGYFNYTTRDWWRQDFLRQRASNISMYDRVIGPQGQTYAGDSSMGTNDGSSVYFLPSDIGRLRRYIVTGVEPRLTAQYRAGAVQGEVIAGARLHYEQANNRDVAGDSPEARSGALISKELRDVMAISAYVRPTFEFFKQRLEIAPGVRVESMLSSVQIRREATEGGLVCDPPGSGSCDVYQPPMSSAVVPPRITHNKLVAIIPGISATGHINEFVSIYGGVHRGFVPPGVRDALVGGGMDLQLKPEWAWNYEAGARGEPFRWLRYEGTFFYIDYRQQVLSPNVANVVNGIVPSGSSTSYGAEASGKLDVATALEAGFELPVTLAYTYAHSVFGGGWSQSIEGNIVPYVPTSVLSARLDFAHPLGIEAQFSLNYMSARYTDPQNSPELSLSGTGGKIDAYTVCNLRVAYNYKPWKSTLFLEARNLFDERYISSLAPAGIQPGMTRQVFAGLRLEN